MRALSIVVRLIVVTSLTFAQTGQGSLQGSIFDRLGHYVFHAPVQVTNTDIGAKYATETDTKGEYTLSLPSGNYALSVEVAGQGAGQRPTLHG
jgi:uncharacterized protein (DUF2141 family)